MDTEVTVGDEIWNNDSIGCGGSLSGDVCGRDRNGSRLGDLDSDRFVSLRECTGRRPKPMKDSRDPILESPDHRPYPE